MLNGLNENCLRGCINQGLASGTNIVLYDFRFYKKIATIWVMAVVDLIYTVFLQSITRIKFSLFMKNPFWSFLVAIGFTVSLILNKDLVLELRELLKRVRNEVLLNLA